MTDTNLTQEYSRRASTTARLLMYLKVNGEVDTPTLMKHFGTGCSSRLFELRREGHKIPSVYVRPGVFRYVYLGQEDE